jgi:hypothetical protein
LNNQSLPSFPAIPLILIRPFLLEQTSGPLEGDE